MLRITQQCDTCISAFRDHVKKYRGALGISSSGNLVEAAARKLRWAVTEKEYLPRFRAEIIAHYLSLNMLVASASVKSIQITDENIQRGLKRVKLDQDQSSATQLALLSDVKDKLVENRQETQIAISEVRSVQTGIIYLQSLGAQVLAMVRNIWSINILTYKTILSLQSCLPTHLDRYWSQEPVTLRDALGRVTPVHLDFIETWEAFLSVLEVRFRQLPGHSKIQRREYSLETYQSNQVIDNATAFRRWFLPGQIIDMSMVFDGLSDLVVSCPGCECMVSKSHYRTVRCENCGLCYRYIEVERKIKTATDKGSTAQTTSSPSSTKMLQETFDDEDRPSEFRRVQVRYSKPSSISQASKSAHITGSYPVVVHGNSSRRGTLYSIDDEVWIYRSDTGDWPNPALTRGLYYCECGGVFTSTDVLQRHLYTSGHMIRLFHRQGWNSSGYYSDSRKSSRFNPVKSRLTSSSIPIPAVLVKNPRTPRAWTSTSRYSDSDSDSYNHPKAGSRNPSTSKRYWNHW